MPRTPKEKPILRRKSPTQERSAETVRVILEAAARILERDGFAGYTTNAIAQRAGVSIGSLYQYFPAKEALTRELIVRESATLLAEAESTLSEPTGRQALFALIDACVRHQLRRPDLARLLDFEEARLPVGKDTQHVSERLHAILRAILKRPDLPRQDDEAVASADLFAMIKGLVDGAGERGELDSASLRKRVARAVFGYLEPPSRAKA